jgi:AcrR family transcriptional regulator
MVIPPPEAPAPTSPPESWIGLARAAKCERLLNAASEVFARSGIEAPMSEVAEAAGAGVASVYRQFPSKRELLAALVIRRMDQLAGAAAAAERRPGDRWSALVEMLHGFVETQSADDFMGEAWSLVAGHPEVEASNERTTAALDGLLSAARAEGRLRPDATALDLRLLFAATRAAKRAEPQHWPRMLELLVDALDSEAHQP